MSNAQITLPGKSRVTPRSVNSPIRVLMITSEWPVSGPTQTSHFIKRQAEFLRAAGIDVDVFPFRGAKRLLNYLRARAQVRKQLAQQPYDLIHAQFGQSGLLALPKRLPLVVTFRGCELLGIVDQNGRRTAAGRLLCWLSHYVAAQADARIVVSSELGRCLTPRSAHVIPSGLDLELFRVIPQQEARSRLGLPLDKRLVLFAANPRESVKRFGLAKEAVERLDPQLAAEMVVVWCVPHTELPVYMNACDALVLTSFHEGSPNVVKEALACNLPVVSVAVGDVPERLQGIEGCEICQDANASAIASALTRVLSRNQRTNGRSAVLDLDEKITTQKVIAVYEEALLASRRKSPAATSSPSACR